MATARMRMRRSWVSVSVVILGCALGVLPMAGANSVTVTAIDVPGARGTYAFGINGGGEIVGRFQGAGATFHGYLRNAGGTFTTFDAPGATRTYAFRVNAAGQIVGVFEETDGKVHGDVTKLKK